MTARRRKKKKGYRFPRTLFSILSLSVALLTGFVAGRDNYFLGEKADKGKVFAAFAEIDVDLESLARMRGSPHPPQSKPARERWLRITEVCDGDTIRLSDGQLVRLIGIDAPESSENRKLKNDIGEMKINIRSAELTALGHESTRHAQKLAEGRNCWLEYEKNKTAMYGRTLAYVHLDNGTILNETMLADGYAKAYVKVSFKYKKRYVLLHSRARFERRGLWRQEEKTPTH